MSLERTIVLALRGVLKELQPHELGIRSSALPTDTHLESCVRALGSWVAELEPRGADVFVASSAVCGLVVPRVHVAAVGAADAATQRRNQASEGPDAPWLVYLSASATGGESGLEVLREVTAADLAQGFARESALPLLNQVEDARSRRVRMRLHDASVELLTRYAELSDSPGGEAHALPLLGLLPSTRADARLTGRALDELEQLRVVPQRVAAALKFLRALSAEERAALEPELRSRLLPGLQHDAVDETLRLGEATLALARGEPAAHEGLCGLTRELAALLRVGSGAFDRMLARVAGDPHPDEDDDEEEGGESGDGDGEGSGSGAARPGQARWDWELLLDDGAEALDGSLVLNDEEAAFEDSLPSFVLLRGDDRMPLRVRAEQGVPLELLATQDLEQYVERGQAAIVTTSTCTNLGALKASTRGAFTLRWHNELRSSDAAAHRAEVDSFIAARAQLCEAVDRMVVRADDSPANAVEGRHWRVLGLLERHPLLVARRCPLESAAYVSAYTALLRLGGLRETAHHLRVWITNIDVAYGTEADRVGAARLLPLHPLRLASAAVSLSLRASTPPFPARLGVTHHDVDVLKPEGTPGIYANVPALRPDAESLAHAARRGLEVAWTLVRPTGLLAALRIALVDLDLSSAARVTDELCAAAARLYEDDAALASGVHLEVWRVVSVDGRLARDAYATLTELGSLASERVLMTPGEDISLTLMPEVVEAENMGSRPCHLAVHAVATPYESVTTTARVTPHARIQYFPGDRGNIQLVELQGEPSLDAYNELLDRSGQILQRRLGGNPTYPPVALANTLVEARVARGGWPVDPLSARDLVSYSEQNDHLIAILADIELIEPRLQERLTALARRTRLDVAALRRAMLALYSERAFFLSLLDEDASQRSLLGKLGPLQAFGEIMSDARPLLPLNLDAPEGRAFIRLVASGGSQSRADLLLLEAPEQNRQETPSDVSALRVVELKSRSKPPTDAGWNALATQALQTYARVRECFSGVRSDGVLEAGAAALRHLAYQEAGRQSLALSWQSALEALTARLESGDAPELSVECWVILHEPWEGERSFSRECPALTSAGTRDDTSEPVTVHFRVVAPGAGDEPSPVRPHAEHATKGPARTRTAVVPHRNAAGPAQNAVPKSAPASQDRSSSSKVPGPGECSRVVPTSEATAAGGSRGSNSAAEIKEAVPTTPDVGALPATQQRPPIALAGMRLELGRTVRGGSPVVWLPNRTDVVNHFNVGITGTMGTGKTQLTKSLLAQLVWRGVDNPTGRGPGLLVFDYKGDYQDSDKEPFATRIGARVLAPEGLPLNPLKTVRPTKRQEFTMIARTFADTMMAIAPRIGMVQRKELVDGVTGCFEEAGLVASDPSTWTRPFPTLRDLQSYLEEHELAVGTPQAVLNDIVEMGIFAETDPEGEMDDFFDAVHVVDLKPLGSMPTLIRAILSFFMNAFYDRMLRTGEALLVRPEGTSYDLRALRRLVLVDEADDFISLGLHSLKNVMQQGRSFGCGVVLSTQFLHHFNRGNDPLRPLIGTWLLHQMADLNPSDVRALFGVQKAQGEQYVTKLASLPKHTSICTGLLAESAGARPGAVLDVHDLPFKDLPGPP